MMMIDYLVAVVKKEGRYIGGLGLLSHEAFVLKIYKGQ
jgi:hypothetical protein